MSPLILALALVQPQSALFDSFEQITPQVAAERVAACGVGRVTVRTDAGQDDDVLVVKATQLSDRQLDCIDKAASFYDVALLPAIQPRYDARRGMRMAALMAEDGRRELKAMGLADRVPPYEPGKTDAATFARQVEALCHAEGALQSRHGPRALDPEWMKRQPPDAFVNGPVHCMITVMLASGYTMAMIAGDVAAPR